VSISVPPHQKNIDMKQQRVPFFWDVTKCLVVVVCRRFGTPDRSHLSRVGQFKIDPVVKGKAVVLDCFTFEDGTDRLSRNVFKKRTINTHAV